MKCFRCGHDGPAEDFYPRRSRKNPVRAAWRSECINCTVELAEQIKQQYMARSEKEIIEDTPVRATCTRCGIERRASEFWRSTSIRKALQSWCIECHGEYNAERRAKARGGA